MSESPIYKLARLVGGVALLPGPLGHQALGQLLISGSRDLEIAGANVALAAAFMQPNLAIQVAVGTLVPAVAIDALSRKEQRRIMGEQRRLERLTAELALQSSATGKTALLSMAPAAVVEALNRNAERRQKADQQKQKDLETQLDDLRQESERTTEEFQRKLAELNRLSKARDDSHIELSQALESQQSKNVVLAKEIHEVMVENERLRQEINDLRNHLEKPVERIGITQTQNPTDSSETKNEEQLTVSSDELAAPKAKKARNAITKIKEGKNNKKTSPT